MHIKCANVRPKQFTQLISGNMILWKCPGCVVFLELPFCNLDREEIAGKIENDGNKLLEFSQKFARGVYGNQEASANNNSQASVNNESQALVNNDLIAERNKLDKEVLMCHLNINSIQNKKVPFHILVV